VDEAQRIAQRVGAVAKTEDDRTAAAEFTERIRNFQDFLARRKKYEAQVALEQKTLEEHRLQRTEPSTNSAQPAAPPGETNVAIEGNVISTTCPGGNSLDLTLEHGGATFRLHSSNFLTIEYYGADWQPPKDFQPCNHLIGLRARVSYRVSIAEPLSREIVSIEVKQ